MALQIRNTLPQLADVVAVHNQLKAQLGAALIIGNLWNKDAADGAAGNATAEHTFFTAPFDLTLTRIEFEPDANLTAHDTNNAVITISRRNSDGTGKVTVATVTTNTASGNWTAFQPKSFGALTNATLTAGQKLTIEIAKGGTGVVVPAGSLRAQDTKYHLDKSELTITAANASDLATSLVLVNQIRGLLVGGGGALFAHLSDTLAHKVSDTTDIAAISASYAIDLSTAQTLANQIKAAFNTHIASTTYHYMADTVNTIAAADATDQNSLNTLLNELKTDINAHIGSGPSAKSLRLVDA